jgi:hypothetical protein
MAKRESLCKIDLLEIACKRQAASGILESGGELLSPLNSRKAKLLRLPLPAWQRRTTRNCHR